MSNTSHSGWAAANLSCNDMFYPDDEFGLGANVDYPDWEFDLSAYAGSAQSPFLPAIELFDAYINLNLNLCKGLGLAQ